MAGVAGSVAAVAHPNEGAFELLNRLARPIHSKRGHGAIAAGRVRGGVGDKRGQDGPMLGEPEARFVEPSHEERAKRIGLRRREMRCGSKIRRGWCLSA